MNNDNKEHVNKILERDNFFVLAATLCDNNKENPKIEMVLTGDKLSNVEILGLMEIAKERLHEKQKLDQNKLDISKFLEKLLKKD